MTKSRLVTLSLLICAASACNDNTTPTTPSGSQTEFTRTEIYLGTLAPAGSGFYSFTLGTDGRVELTLNSLTDPSSGDLLDRTLTLGLGRPAAMDCAVTSSSDVTPGFGAQVSSSIQAGTYCVRISDAGGLPASADFAVRITLRTGNVPPTPTPGTITFASQVIPQGFTSRAFDATQNGTLTVRLDALTDPAARVDIGIGIPPGSGGGCAATRFLRGVGPGASVSLDVIRASYCVTVRDPGSLTAPLGFTVLIDHP
ncbi:MAG: hypothetical protein R2752_19280 [Vicinamibacterales bacterium]